MTNKVKVTKLEDFPPERIMELIRVVCLSVMSRMDEKGYLVVEEIDDKVTDVVFKDL